MMKIVAITETNGSSRHGAVHQPVCLSIIEVVELHIPTEALVIPKRKKGPTDTEPLRS